MSTRLAAYGRAGWPSSEMGWFNRALIAGGAVAGAYLAVSACMAAGLTRTMRVRPEDDPSAVGLDFVNVTFMSRDGEAPLAGWIIPPGGRVSSIDPASVRWIVMVHGFGTNRTNPSASSLGLAGDLAKRGFGLLMFDLRSCGESGGEHGSAGYFERFDLLGAIDFLMSSGVEGSRIGVHGTSLGGAVALMACANPGIVGAVVADSSFADLSVRMREEMTGSRRVLNLFLPGARLMSKSIFGMDLNEVSPARNIAAVDTPALIVHGEMDNMVPVRHARILERAIGADPDSPRDDRSVWIVPGAGHAQCYRTMRGEYVNRVAGFFERHLSK